MGSCEGKGVVGQKQGGGIIARSPPRARHDDIPGFSSDYQMLGVVGKGEFGSVFKVRHKATQEERAAKVIRKLGNPVIIAQLKAESYVARVPRHENLSEQFRFYDSPSAAAIVYEYCAGGEVAYSLEGRSHYTEATVCIVVKGLLRAIAHLHSVHLAHMDVKPQNMLFVRKPEPDRPISVSDVRLVDYGSLTPFTPGKPSITVPAGTPHFAAPEVVTHVCAQCARGVGPISGGISSASELAKGLCPRPFDERADVYSAAVVAFILAVGSHPFVPQVCRDTLPSFFDRVLRGDLQLTSRFYRLSLEVQELLLSGLASDFQKRPSAAEMLQSPWLTSIGDYESKSPAADSGTDTAPVDDEQRRGGGGLPLTVSRAHQEESSTLSKVSHGMLDLRENRTDMHGTLQATRSSFHDDLRAICSSSGRSTARQELRIALSQPAEKPRPLAQTVSDAAAGEWKVPAFKMPATPQPRGRFGRSQQPLPNIKAVPEVLSEVCSQSEATRGSPVTSPRDDHWGHPGME